METQISSTFYYIKTKDEIGDTIRTAVFKLKNGLFHAYSSYDQKDDKKIIGFGESENDKTAINLSKQDLRKEWEAKKGINFLDHTLY
ncbi:MULTISPECIES: hypothetical protein [Bacillaceae]|jgi:hypothetical protein|uniref:Uncharacterized protein n=1 Tax=Cytobacillus purgationiresistens TaxID=863449 RepID=A0ABU0AIX1_9BACI|nr:MULTISPECIES: hypothetical protein [Bacillaceae]MCM3323310.1 hypothetical protein [Cytobacillus kochii]MCM3345705.1 hypothetical protein [Cytobacillus kochii]MCM3653681.1 hypothetical protein [Metabacillus litoralis]MDQ0186721.1 hypothetical protein [Cytobacillus kochii]MDQ0271187.1 hypothetical protein [Cytobacillus purgationiresistens]